MADALDPKNPNEEQRRSNQEEIIGALDEDEDEEELEYIDETETDEEDLES